MVRIPAFENLFVFFPRHSLRELVSPGLRTGITLMRELAVFPQLMPLRASHKNFFSGIRITSPAIPATTATIEPLAINPQQYPYSDPTYLKQTADTTAYRNRLKASIQPTQRSTHNGPQQPTCDSNQPTATRRPSTGQQRPAHNNQFPEFNHSVRSGASTC